MSAINQKTEAGLFRRGFKLREVRVVVRNQLYLTALSLVGAAILGWVEPRVAHFAAGVALITFNFYYLAKFVQRLVHYKSSGTAVVELLVHFYGRLLLTGGAIFALIVWAGVWPPALLAGLSTVLLTIIVWGLTRLIEHKAKEA
jgi:hypothetical protein